MPEDKNDVTIGVISRLVKALDRAGKAGGLPKHLRIYLTEFGIQSFPDKISGVPLDASRRTTRSPSTSRT